MKKLLLFTFALFLWTGAWAQTKLEPTDVVQVGETPKLDEGCLAALHDGITSGENNLTNGNLPLTIYYDLGEAKSVGAVIMFWTRCTASAYSIYVTNVLPTSDNSGDWGDAVASETSYTFEDNTVKEKDYNFSGKKGRYVIFQFTSKNSWAASYGIKLNEIEVYEPYTQILTSIASSNYIYPTHMYVPTSVLDQYGKDYHGATTWSMPGCTGFNPTGEGFYFSDLSAEGIYTLTVSSTGNPSQTNSKKFALVRTVPNTSIIPAIDTNNSFVIFSGELNIDANDKQPGWQAPSSESFNTMSGALRIHNFGSFALRKNDLGTDASEVQSIVFDVYALDNHNIKVNIDNSNLAAPLSSSVVPGWNHLVIPVNTTIATGLAPNSVVKIYLDEANASTEDMLIYNVYFSKVAPDPDDDVKPVMVSAALASKTHNSATLTLNATDNSGKVKFHIVDTSNSIDVTSGNADSGVNFSYTVTGLTAETSYNFTITAVDASDNVSDESKSVEVTTNSAPPGIDLTAGGHTIHVTPYHYSNNVYKLVITSDDEMSDLGGSFWNVNGVGTDMRTNSETHTFNVSQDKKTITITCTSTSAPNMYTPLYVMMPGEVNFGYVNLNWIDVVQAVTITSAGWASFSSDKDLNFDGIDNLSAYKATVNGENDVTLVEVTEVKAGEGIILKGTADTYNVPVMISAPDALAGNLLKPGYHKVTEGEVGSIYAFGKYNGGVAFVKAAKDYKVSAGRAYLDVNGTGAKNAEYLNFYIGQEEGETDGINKVNTLVETGVRYNLAGQRVGNDYKGIVIVNGRKVVIK